MWCLNILNKLTKTAKNIKGIRINYIVKELHLEGIKSLKTPFIEAVDRLNHKAIKFLEHFLMTQMQPSNHVHTSWDL